MDMRHIEIEAEEKAKDPAVDWSLAPEWARCWAMDDDGTARWYQSRPAMHNGDWGCAAKKESAPSFGLDPKHWQESLTHYPFKNPLTAAVEDAYLKAPRHPEDRVPTKAPVGDNGIGHEHKAEIDPSRWPPYRSLDDTINRPAHYAKQGDIECIDVLEQLAEDGHDFRILNAMKYLWRYRHKGGHESLQKARWYIDRALEFPNDG